MAVRNTARFEKTAARFAPSISADRSNRRRRDSMIKITNAQLWVHDQDEALAFYTEKVGMEVRADVTVPQVGDVRWLTGSPPGQLADSVVLIGSPGSTKMAAEPAPDAFRTDEFGAHRFQTGWRLAAGPPSPG